MPHLNSWRRFSLKFNHSPADLDRPAKPLKLQECWKLHGRGLCVFQDTWDEDHKVVQCLASSSAALGNWNQWNLRWQQQIWHLCDSRHLAVKGKPNTLLSLHGSINSTMLKDTLLAWALQACYMFPSLELHGCRVNYTFSLLRRSTSADCQAFVSVFPGMPFINYMAQKWPAGSFIRSSSLFTTARSSQTNITIS